MVEAYQGLRESGAENYGVSVADRLGGQGETPLGTLVSSQVQALIQEITLNHGRNRGISTALSNRYGAMPQARDERRTALINLVEQGSGGMPEGGDDDRRKATPGKYSPSQAVRAALDNAGIEDRHRATLFGRRSVVITQGVILGIMHTLIQHRLISARGALQFFTDYSWTFGSRGNDLGKTIELVTSIGDSAAAETEDSISKLRVEIFLGLYQTPKQESSVAIPSDDLAFLNNHFQPIGVSIIPVSADGENTSYRLEYAHEVSRAAVFYHLALIEGINWDLLKKPGGDLNREIENILKGHFVDSKTGVELAQQYNTIRQSVDFAISRNVRKIWQMSSEALKKAFPEDVVTNDRNRDIVLQSRQVFKLVMAGMTDKEIAAAGVRRELIRRTREELVLRGIEPPVVDRRPMTLADATQNNLLKRKYRDRQGVGRPLSSALRALGYHFRPDRLHHFVEVLSEAGIDIRLITRQTGDDKRLLMYYYVGEGVLSAIKAALQDNSIAAGFQSNPVTRISGDPTIAVPSTNGLLAPTEQKRRNPHPEGEMATLGTLLTSRFGVGSRHVSGIVQDLFDGGYEGSIYGFMYREKNGQGKMRFFYPLSQEEALIKYIEERLPAQ